MVEAMVDKSPEYFKQFNKTFKFFTHPTLPNEFLHFSNYAYGFHKKVRLTSATQGTIMHAYTHTITPLYTCFKYLNNLTEKLALKGSLQQDKRV